VGTPEIRVIKLRFAGSCRLCGIALEQGAEAVHDRAARKVTCLACHEAVVPDDDGPPATAADVAVAESEVAPIDLGEAGGSAAREYARRKAKREEELQDRGRFARIIGRLRGEPQSEEAWRKGADGEVLVAGRLERRLREAGVVVMHDRRIPGSRANIDHIAVGPGGVTVIDAKNYDGKVRTESRGGLFTPRTEDLRIGGRRRTKLVEGVKRQVELVRAALVAEFPDIDVRGALCMADADGLPLFGHPQVDGIPVDGSRHIAKIAARPADPSIDVDAVARLLAERFPRA
jgi:hypothetical protein